MSQAKLIKEINTITGLEDFEESKLEFEFMRKYMSLEGECLCGKKLKNLFYIEHKKTYKQYIVGCECINHFNNETWSSKAESLQYLSKHHCKYHKHKGKPWTEVFEDDMGYIMFLIQKGILYHSHKVVLKHIMNLLEA